MYGLTYRVQIEAAERLVEEGIRLDRIDADLTRAKGFGISNVIFIASFVFSKMVGLCSRYKFATEGS